MEMKLKRFAHNYRAGRRESQCANSRLSDFKAQVLYCPLYRLPNETRPEYKSARLSGIPPHFSAPNNEVCEESSSDKAQRVACVQATGS